MLQTVPLVAPSGILYRRHLDAVQCAKRPSAAIEVVPQAEDGLDTAAGTSQRCSIRVEELLAFSSSLPLPQVAKRFGVGIEVMPQTEDGDADTAVLEEMITTGPKPKLVAVSQIGTNSGAGTSIAHQAVSISTVRLALAQALKANYSRASLLPCNSLPRHAMSSGSRLVSGLHSCVICRLDVKAPCPHCRPRVRCGSCRQGHATTWRPIPLGCMPERRPGVRFLGVPFDSLQELCSMQPLHAADLPRVRLVERHQPHGSDKTCLLQTRFRPALLLRSCRWMCAPSGATG